MRWVMLVDKNKHRIAKMDGQWRMYCPARGTDSLIYTSEFSDVEVLMNSPCPHLVWRDNQFKVTGA